ncbi:MAG TPA: hypothetical protein VLG46_17195 [Anaerolineae bacterium]|nr:hypothetical protein [Anaerolineae bacterium]
MLHKGFSVAVVIALLLALSLPVGATVVGANSVFDTFNEVVVKDPSDTDLDPYWWIIQNGEAGQFYQLCSDDSVACTQAEEENGTTFARLRLWPDATPGHFICSEISELRTGYSYGQGVWLPTPDHPVIATARVRFSPNYLEDGSGGAVGTAGFWLYNSYIDFPNMTLQPMTALGFAWGEEGSSGGDFEGLRVMVLRDSVSLYQKTIRPAVDMSAWLTWKMKWSAGSNGKQDVRFWVDDKPVGHVILHDPLPALSLTFWIDNQFALELSNPPLVEYHNPITDQYFDIDSVEIHQE